MEQQGEYLDTQAESANPQDVYQQAMMPQMQGQQMMAQEALMAQLMGGGGNNPVPRLARGEALVGIR